MKLKVFGLSLVALFAFTSVMPSCKKDKEEPKVEQPSPEEIAKKKAEEEKKKQEEEAKRKAEEERKSKEEERKNLPPAKLQLGGKMAEYSQKEVQEKIWDFIANPNEVVFKADRLTIIDFNAVWCAPCKKLKPELEKRAELYKDRAYFIGVDSDKNPQFYRMSCNLFSKTNPYFGTGIPAMILISRDGKKVETLVGFNSATMPSIDKFLEENW